MVLNKSTELKNNETLWSDYHKIVDLCGKDSKQAVSMLKVCIKNTAYLETLYTKGK
jgi:hypothetical protein